MIGDAPVDADGDGVTDGDAADPDTAEGDATGDEGVTDGETLPVDDGRVADEEPAPDGEAGADEDNACVDGAGEDGVDDGVPPPGGVACAVVGSAELLDDTGLHPAAISAITARIAAIAVPRHRRTRIVNPHRPALVAGHAINGVPAMRTFPIKQV